MNFQTKFSIYIKQIKQNYAIFIALIVIFGFFIFKQNNHAKVVDISKSLEILNDEYEDTGAKSRFRFQAQVGGKNNILFGDRLFIQSQYKTNSYGERVISGLDGENIVNIEMDFQVDKELHIIKRVFSGSKLLEERYFNDGPRFREFSFLNELSCFSCGCSCYQNMEGIYVNGYLYVLVDSYSNGEYRNILKNFQKGIFRLNTLDENPEREKLFAGDVNQFFISTDGKIIIFNKKQRKLPE